MNSLFMKSENSINCNTYKLAEGCSTININLGIYQDIVEKAYQKALLDRIVQKIWDHKYTIWDPEPSEITNRLGWLDIAGRMKAKLPGLIEMVENIRYQGFKRAVLLGMGGSSLAPEVLRKTFGVREGYLDLTILDSTDPGTILDLEEEINIHDTLFIVSTKSGTTPETLSFFKYFYNFTVNKVGHDNAGMHFIAITDPGSKLVDIAKNLGFREIFENDPNIGGRYSALSYFGLVPAALLGIDLDKLLQRAISAEEKAKAENCNESLLLGVALGELAKVGRDKLTFLFPSKIESFGDWIEQLIAESTGKEGKGILPVVGEKIGAIKVYGNDRVFVNFQEGTDTHNKNVLNSLIEMGFPVVNIQLNDIYDLGEQFFLWEMATAIAGYCLKINPFDQPNVESSKILTRKMLNEYLANGELIYPDPVMEKDGLIVYGIASGKSLAGVIQNFIEQIKPGNYLSIQAYLESSPEIKRKLEDLRIAIRDKTHMATTSGFGPRFLHSTGQLHKGDGGNGLFIQITANMPKDVIIPNVAGTGDGSITFGTLKTAQVLGDYQALKEANRKVMRIDLGSQIHKNLKKLISIFEN